MQTVILTDDQGYYPIAAYPTHGAARIDGGLHTEVDRHRNYPRERSDSRVCSCLKALNEISECQLHLSRSQPESHASRLGQNFSTASRGPQKADAEINRRCSDDPDRIYRCAHDS